MSRSSIAFAIIGVIVFLILLSIFTRSSGSNTQLTNYLNATVGAGQRSTHLMTFTSNDTTKTLKVVVPSLTCATAVNWTILPRTTGGEDETGTIKIGTTAGDDDFGTQTITVGDVSDVILNGASNYVCSLPTIGTAVLYFTVTLTAGSPATFLFEVISSGVFENV